MVGNMLLQQRRVGLFQRGAGPRQEAFVRVLTLPALCVIHHVIGIGGQHEQQFVAIGKDEGPVFRFDFAALVYRNQPQLNTLLQRREFLLGGSF